MSVYGGTASHSLHLSWDSSHLAQDSMAGLTEGQLFVLIVEIPSQFTLTFPALYTTLSNTTS